MKKYLFPILTVVALSTGCSSSTGEQEQSDGQHTEHNEKNAPVLTYNIGSDDWSVVTNYTDSPKVLEAYQFAVSNPEVLNYMPCYCGCYEEDGHTSNTNCFVDKIEGTTVTLDTMGFG
ncbi:Protein of unknown function with PCYCGC motif-containing protein [Bacillus sp. UNCCL13]|nr:Protein of unknown function with PCYCGC motif-containing protein [Bacillus sp. UNCCL13]